MNTEPQGEIFPESHKRRGESYDDINKREALVKKLLLQQKREAHKPPKPPAKTPAERSKTYRERKKYRPRAESEATTPALIPSKILRTIPSNLNLSSSTDNPESDQYPAETMQQKQIMLKEKTKDSEMNFNEVQEAPVQKAQNETDSNDINARYDLISSSLSPESDHYQNSVELQEEEANKDSEMNFDEVEDTQVDLETTSLNESDSGEISIRDIVPTNEDFANMTPAEKAKEAARRYRLLKKKSKPTKASPVTSAERSRTYRERQKLLQNAAKIITEASDIEKVTCRKQEEKTTQHNNNYNANKKLRPARRPPQTPAEKSRAYRERKKLRLLAAVEAMTPITTEVSQITQAVTPVEEAMSSPQNYNDVNNDNNEDEFQSDYSGTKKRLRNVLTQDERVAAIRQYDLLPSYKKIARSFNCSVGQIKNVVANREAILEFHEATDILSNHTNDEKEVRRRKLNFLGYCLYEYTQRAEYHLKSDVNEVLIYKRAIEFRDLMQIDNFTPNKSWINQFKAAFSINPPDPKVAITRRPRKSMDLRNIMSFCGKYSSMAPNLEPTPHTPLISGKCMDQILSHSKALVFAASQNQDISAELESEAEDDDDCVAVESPTELIEIKKEDDIDRYDSPRTPINQELDDNTNHCPLKIEKLHHSPLHIHDYQSTEGNIPETEPAHSSGHNSEANDEAPLPKCVDTFKDALRLLKPLEDFALMRENYRVIGLLSQLETIFETGKKAEESGFSGFS